MTEKGGRKDKNQNIQVFVRLRPLNQRERDIKSLGVVNVENNREVVIKTAPNSTYTKKFTFDRAFAPNATQVEVYHDVVSPLIEEVLAGYNCTVFAYGQTGTGKTHTMVGENTSQDTTWQNDPLAGIIPRALSQLFDELRISNTEYTVRVSYLELYNEELFDLLSSDDNSKLRIYEDVTRKGSNIVNGLEEITVNNKNEVYQIMAQGQDRKRVASTQMNAQSSDDPNGKHKSYRSHTVFTIVVHMKEISPEGEELVKIGKLNLVDLAGSENISKAGSDNPAKRERARECVNINQSLLTLGRVITALVERHPHIPYRESKLTRILQESLGGRTKTSIIATISPGHKDLEETMSTLEYAHRAKNIQNKPEVNQKMTKRAILREYVEEIDKLKRDLQAARDKSAAGKRGIDGQDERVNVGRGEAEPHIRVYLTTARFTELTLKEEEQRKEIQELLLKKRAMEDEKVRMESVFQEMEQKLQERQAELTNTKEVLQITKEKLFDTKIALVSRQEEVGEQRHLVQEITKKEQQLQQQARQLVGVAEIATDHVSKLHESIEKRKTLEATNLDMAASFRSQASDSRQQLEIQLARVDDTASDHCKRINSGLDAYAKSTVETQQQTKGKFDSMIEQIKLAMEEAKSLSAASSASLSTASVEQSSAVRSALASQLALWRKVASSCSSAAEDCLKGITSAPLLEELTAALQTWQAAALNQVSQLQSVSRVNCETTRQGSRLVAKDVASIAEVAANAAESANNGLEQALKEIALEKQEMESGLNNQLLEIQQERAEAQTRLQAWMVAEREMLEEEKRRMEAAWRRMEENLVRHVDNELAALDLRLNKRVQEIEQKKIELEEKISAQISRQKQANAVSEQCRRFADDANARLRRYENDAERHVEIMIEQMDQGCDRVSSELASVCEIASKPAADWRERLLAAVQLLHGSIEREIAESISTNEKQCEQFVSQLEKNIEDNLLTAKNSTDSVVQKFQECGTPTLETLSKASTTCIQVSKSAETQQAAAAAILVSLQKTIGEYTAAARREVTELSAAEERFMSDYRLYTPSGQTPGRTQYKYPKQLAAASPHDRILERYRASRRQKTVEEYIEIDSDISRSGSESSLSEDSPLNSAVKLNNIVKSTSEADIYANRKLKNQSKENADRSFNFKRPSKLPAPMHTKNPLLERNGDK